MPYMEDTKESKLLLLLSELAQMRELALQLLGAGEQLDRQRSPAEFCRSLAAKMLSSVDILICAAATLGSAGEEEEEGRARRWRQQQQEVSFPQDLPAPGAFGYNYCSSLSKKRKMLPRRKVQVKVDPSSSSPSASLNDGFSWRKYGNKSILGAKHPRSYYRCKERVSRGCLATKQVQRSEDDPQLFDIIYHGDHTCRRSCGGLQPAPPPPPPPLPLLEVQEADAGQSAERAAEEAAAAAEEAEGVLFLTGSSALLDELCLTSETNSEGDVELMDGDFWSTGFDDGAFLSFAYDRI